MFQLAVAGWPTWCANRSDRIRFLISRIGSCLSFVLWENIYDSYIHTVVHRRIKIPNLYHKKIKATLKRVDSPNNRKKLTKRWSKKMYKKLYKIGFINCGFHYLKVSDVFFRKWADTGSMVNVKFRFSEKATKISKKNSTHWSKCQNKWIFCGLLTMS